MIKFLVVETGTCRILFQCRNSVRDEPINKVMQLLTPILASIRVLQDQLRSQLHEIQLGASIALISCHGYGGCFTLIVRGQRRSYVQIKALRKAVCQFIHVLCGGPCWQRLRLTFSGGEASAAAAAATNETLQKCIDIMLRRHKAHWKQYLRIGSTFNPQLHWRQIP